MIKPSNIQCDLRSLQWHLMHKWRENQTHTITSIHIFTHTYTIFSSDLMTFTEQCHANLISDSHSTHSLIKAIICVFFLTGSYLAVVSGEYQCPISTWVHCTRKQLIFMIHPHPSTLWNTRKTVRHKIPDLSNKTKSVHCNSPLQNLQISGWTVGGFSHSQCPHTHTPHAHNAQTQNIAWFSLFDLHIGNQLFY